MLALVRDYQESFFHRSLAGTEKAEEEKPSPRGWNHWPQRRKLPSEIARLAEVAVYGTLSETGRLSLPARGAQTWTAPERSYRGEQHKTTGYYVL
jgi:hypothetical protein